MVRLFYRIKQLILILGDSISYFLGFWIALFLRHLALPSAFTIEQHLALFAMVFFLWVIINFINNLYDLDQYNQSPAFYKRFIETGVMSFIVGIIFFYILPSGRIAPKTILILTVVFGYAISLGWRLLYHALFRDRALKTRVLFVGYTEEMEELADMLQASNRGGFTLSAWIDPEQRVDKQKRSSVDVYHSLKTVRPAITNHKITTVVIAPHLRREDAALRELYELLFWDVHITDLASFYESLTGRIPPSTFSEGWFLDHLRHKETPIYDRMCALIDYTIGCILCVFFLIILPCVALVITCDSRGPIFIAQERVGKFGKRFKLYKFRSMYALSPDGSAETSGVQFAVKGDARITRVGTFLRKTRLDEIPQCVNLLKRDITLVGPRPERPEIVRELERRMPYYPLRHIVLPGLTSWALLHQNYTDNLETSLQKLQYDLYYIKNRSLLLDLSILLRTVNVVVRMMGQ